MARIATSEAPGGSLLTCSGQNELRATSQHSHSEGAFTAGERLAGGGRACIVQLGAQEWLQKRIGPGQLMWVCSSYWIVCMFGALSIVCEVESGCTQIAPASGTYRWHPGVWDDSVSCSLEVFGWLRGTHPGVGHDKGAAWDRLARHEESPGGIGFERKL